MRKKRSYAPSTRHLTRTHAFPMTDVNFSLQYKISPHSCEKKVTESGHVTHLVHSLNKRLLKTRFGNLVILHRSVRGTVHDTLP